MLHKRLTEAGCKVRSEAQAKTVSEYARVAAHLTQRMLCLGGGLSPLLAT